MAACLIEVVDELDVTCSCGWLLPHGVTPHRNEADLGENTIVAGAVVSLDCPQCGHGHSFYSPRAAAAAPKEVQRRLGIDPDS